MELPLSKMEIINRLAVRHGFTRYLELCTSKTGHFYRLLDRRALPTAHRLMYYCPAGYEDGLAIDFRTEGMNIGECISEISAKGLRYDIILVDPFHDYASSYRDLAAAFDLLDAGGMLVVHDCRPPNIAVATPEFIEGEWCGVTYKAYLDFVFARRLDYSTVDTDYGCGIVRKLDRQSRWARFLRTTASFLDRDPQRRSERRQSILLRQQWRDIGNDFDRAFSFFEKHQKQLLNLISSDEFSRTL